MDWAVMAVILGVIGALTMLTMDGDGEGEGEGEGGAGGNDKDDDAADRSRLKDTHTREEVEELLRAESSRSEKKLEAEREKIREQAREEYEKQLEEEKRKAEMSAAERAEAEKREAEQRAEQAESELKAEREARARADFVASNAGELDRGWRAYALQELAARAEDESMEDVLARVQEEYKAETGGQGAPGRTGLPGRPSGGKPATGELYSREQLEAMGEEEILANQDKVNASLAALNN